jgi:hypothetical protein
VPASSVTKPAYRSPEGTYEKVLKDVMEDPDLTPVEFRVLLYLATKPEGWEIHAGQVAHALPVLGSKRTVERALAGLRRKGYLIAQQGRDQDAGTFGQHVTRLRRDLVVKTKNDSSAQVGTATPKPAVAVNGGHRDNGTDSEDTQKEGASGELDFVSNPDQEQAAPDGAAGTGKPENTLYGARRGRRAPVGKATAAAGSFDWASLPPVKSRPAPLTPEQKAAQEEELDALGRMFGLPPSIPRKATPEDLREITEGIDFGPEPQAPNPVATAEEGAHREAV